MILAVPLDYNEQAVKKCVQVPLRTKQSRSNRGCGVCHRHRRRCITSSLISAAVIETSHDVSGAWTNIGTLKPKI